jgi:hypothetical protein
VCEKTKTKERLSEISEQLTKTTMPYHRLSDDLKHAAIRLHNRELISTTDILDAVGFSHTTFFRVLKLHRETGHVSKPKGLRRRHGKPRALNFSDVHYLLELVKQQPD